MANDMAEQNRMGRRFGWLFATTSCGPERAVGYVQCAWPGNAEHSESAFTERSGDCCDGFSKHDGSLGALHVAAVAFGIFSVTALQKKAGFFVALFMQV